MRKNLIICLIAFQSMAIVLSQTNDEAVSGNWESSIHIEGGFIYPDGWMKESLAIRQNISYYYVDQLSDGFLYSLTSGMVLGFRWELFQPRFKTGISSGLRYTRFSTEMTGYTSSYSDFFYLRYSVEGGDTKFARVKSLTELNNLISIPLELRWLPIKFKDLGFFLKAGIEYRILKFGNQTNINFHDDAMNEYQDEVLDIVQVKLNKSYSVFYSSIGINYGKEGKPNYMFEVLFPSVFLTENNFTLVDVEYFTGFKLSVNFPVK